jgi:hypothetical protein
VAIANREFAEKMFGSVPNAMGKFFRMQDGTRIQVVGVAEDGKYLNLTESHQPAVYVPFMQHADNQASIIVLTSALGLCRSERV